MFAHGERFVGATRSETSTFVRFYDLEGDRVRFNVIESRWDTDPPESRWHSNVLRGHRHAELVAALAEAGFTSPRSYGDLSFSPYDKRKSHLLVLEAARSSD